MEEKKKSDANEEIVDEQVDSVSDTDAQSDSINSNASEDTVPKEQYLRLLADVENMKKQMSASMDSQRARSFTEVLEQLLPHMERWYLGLEHIPESHMKESWYIGLIQVQDQLRSSLEHLGVEPVACVGEKYNPQKHEAAAMNGSDEDGDLIVEHVLQQGYALNGKLLYPARVSVSVLKPDEDE